ncbi:MAG: hypothetical protein AB7F74_06055 [Parvibaculaceae bacterium]
MGLIIVGEEHRTRHIVSFRAEDASSSRTISVKVFTEVIDDFGGLGLDRAARIVEGKYDSGEVEADGSIVVRPTLYLKAEALTPDKMKWASYTSSPKS